MDPTEPQPPPLPIGPQLNARRATLILLLFSGAQFAVGIVVGLFAGVEQAAHTQPVADHGFRLNPVLTAWATFLALIAGGAVMVVASRSWLAQELASTEPTGAAWVRGSTRHILAGLVIGALTGLVCSVVMGLFAQILPQHRYGPLTQLAMSSGLVRAAWFAFVLGAPVIEEPLFRGIFYGGLRQSLGHAKAAILTTAIFCALHVSEWIYFWPAVLGIGALAVLALWIRLRSRAIGPAIALHFGYNAMIASLVLVAIVFDRK